MRTAFAVCALAGVSSAVSLDPLAIPDWIAGFIFGLTGDNHLSEIEQCYSGGQGLVTDAEKALADIKSGAFISGIQDFGKVIWDLPEALQNCENMGDDIAKIEDWAQVFTHPVSLAKKISKNWLLHGVDVKKDIALEEASWASADYFGAGKEAAAAVELLVPFEKTELWKIDFKAPFEFVGGLLDGLVGDNHLDELYTCSSDIEAIVKSVDVALRLLEQKKYVELGKFFETIGTTLMISLKECSTMGEDISAIEEWSKIFDDKTKLIETITKHALLHKKKIEADIKAAKTDWNSGNFYKAGEDAADLLTLALGPVKKESYLDVSQAANGFEIKDVLSFLGGFMLEILKLEKVPDFTACGIDAAIMGFELSWIYGYAKAGQIEMTTKLAVGWIKDLPDTLVNPCKTGIPEQFNELIAWVESLTSDLPALLETIAKNLASHTEAVSTVVADIYAKLATEDYQTVGKDVAYLLELATGKVQPAPPSALQVVDLDPLAVPDFVAGFMYGMTGNNHLAEIEQCFKGTQTLASDAQTALNDIKHGNFIQGIKDFGTIIWDLPDGFAACTGMDDDIAAIEQWAEIFKEPVKLINTITSHMLASGDEIKADIADEQDDWGNKQYFDAGNDTAAAFTVLIGPINDDWSESIFLQ